MKMTNEDAINLLDNLLGMIEDSQDNDYDTALKMAIEALKQIRCKDCKHFSRTLFLGSGYNCGNCHRGTAIRPGVGDVMRPDDYCSRAERSEEE